MDADAAGQGSSDAVQEMWPEVDDFDLGSFVELHGLGDNSPLGVIVGQERQGTDVLASHFNGQKGLIATCSGDGKYLVNTMDDQLLSVDEHNLRPWDPPGPEDGGFDLLWPSVADEMFQLPTVAASFLAAKGWCLLHINMPDDQCAAAAQQARHLKDFSAPRQEFLADFMGHAGTGRSAAFSSSHLQQEGAAFTDLVRCSGKLTKLMHGLKALTFDAMGFNSYSRSKSYVWVPYADSDEAERYPSLPLSEDDVEKGVIEEHIHFIRRRKVCMMLIIESAESELWLYPKDDDLGFQNVRIPISKKKLLLFRHDLMSFKYQPADTTSVVLQSWILAEPPRLAPAAVFDDEYQRNEAYGIKKGILCPEDERVCIMSLMTRLPGNSDGLAKYTTALLAGADASKFIPHTRFDMSEYFSADYKDVPGKSMTAHGGLCSDKEVYSFDNEFFRISDYDANMMAPGQRILVEVGYQCLSLSGYTRESLWNHKCGVYIGDMGTDVMPGWNISMEGMVKPSACDGMKNFITSGRLSHVLGMNGPTWSVDTACSSSLVATNVAVNALRPLVAEDSMFLRFHDSALKNALAAGIMVIVSPYFYVTLSKAQMFSVNGRCFTFDMSGNGYARGEGCGCLHLRTSHAREDMDTQVAVLMGVNVNQDGKSATLTAPNGPSQQACIKASLDEAGLSSAEITVAECHGTGTALGDPIEVGALRRAIGENNSVPVLLTSAKSNICHLESAAGMAGIEKCIVMLLASIGTPNCHLSRLNPHLDLSGFPVLVENEVTNTGLNSGLSGVSSFGYGGTNARGDVWAQCRVGSQKSGELDFEKVDQVCVTCPITMGLIDWITGEPISLKPGLDRKTNKAAVLRDEFASYDVSAHVYSGGYRYRSMPLMKADPQDRLDPTMTLYIRGSWTAFQYYEEMDPDGPGCYSYTMMLGEARYDTFHLCLDKDSNMDIYPAINKASPKIWICGPNGARNGRTWIIDGRDRQVPAGSSFKIRFRWGREVKSISFEDNPSWLRNLSIPFKHTYWVIGTWTAWKFQVMTQVGEKGDGVWSTRVKIGNEGVEQFQFARDRDWNQVIYPARRRATDPDVPARGPDDMGDGKTWLIRGTPGEVFDLQLGISDAKVTVSLTDAYGARKVWKSEEGWNRHTYFVAGLFNGWNCEPMIMNPKMPGVFTAFGVLPNYANQENKLGYATWFYIVVDEDFHYCYYPQLEDAGPGESIVQGPDGEGEGLHWMAYSTFGSGAVFEICLDLTAEDRRKVVTWKFLTED